MRGADVMWLLGRLRDPHLPAVRRVHALTGAADACFAVSLAGSLFFSVSLDAARPRIILYLAVTMAPFVVMAPLVGPLIDRVPGGERLALVAANAARAVIVLVMANHLTDLLFYPETFLVLVLAKVYAVGRCAVVPHLVRDPDALVAANSELSLVSLLAGAAGGGLGIAILNLADATWVLRVSSLLYLAATVAAMRVPKPEGPSASPPVLEYEELHAPSPVLAAAAMIVLRGSVGFLTFHLGFALKRAGEPAWFFGLVLAASGVGAFFGTVVAPHLRDRMREEGMLATALAVPAGLAVLGGIGFSRLGTILAVAGLGVASTGGRQAFDSLIQREAPDADRARAFARFESYFQLGWVVGALLAVALRLVAFAGMLVVGGSLGAGAVLYATSSRVLLRRPGPSEVVVWAGGIHERHGRVLLGVETLVTAERLQVEGAYRQVVVQAQMAVDLLRDELKPPVGPGRSGEAEDDLDALLALRAAAVADGAVVSRAEALRALVLARRIMNCCVDGGTSSAS